MGVRIAHGDVDAAPLSGRSQKDFMMIHAHFPSLTSIMLELVFPPKGWQLNTFSPGTTFQG